MTGYSGAENNREKANVSLLPERVGIYRSTTYLSSARINQGCVLFAYALIAASGVTHIGRKVVSMFLVDLKMYIASNLQCWLPNPNQDRICFYNGAIDQLRTV